MPAMRVEATWLSPLKRLLQCTPVLGEEESGELAYVAVNLTFFRDVRPVWLEPEAPSVRLGIRPAQLLIRRSGTRLSIHLEYDRRRRRHSLLKCEYLRTSTEQTR
jgi:hypothetical protein